MISLDFSNLARVKGPHGLAAEQLRATPAQIGKALKKIKARNQGFFTTVDDAALVSKINGFAREIEGKYKDIVVLGIGGSALGTICLQQSLKHLFENELNGLSPYPRLHVLDNIDPALICDFEDLMDSGKTLFIVVTKSGTTPETLAQYSYYSHKIYQKKLLPRDHFVFVTEQKNNLLRQIAKNENIRCFPIPENVGGRFSVLTAVSLLPARLIGIDIEKLLLGAREMRDSFLNADFKTNLPYQLALTQYLLAKKGKKINVLMPYSQKLIRLADWYRQLLAESTGKENKGLTPVSALGVTDQHSQSQLYNEGPNDKLLMFINVENLGPCMPVPAMIKSSGSIFPDGLTFNRLMHTEMEGTVASLTKNKRPNITINIPEVDEFNLGELFMLFMGATAFLGEFFKINAYNQPGVELSKKITRELLQK
jgi:glucose-6-phosphate isomerase